MVDTLRIVSSEDVGRDEASAESLLKKHKVTLNKHASFEGDFTVNKRNKLNHTYGPKQKTDELFVLLKPASN